MPFLAVYLVAFYVHSVCVPVYVCMSACLSVVHAARRVNQRIDTVYSHRWVTGQ